MGTTSLTVLEKDQIKDIDLTKIDVVHSVVAMLRSTIDTHHNTMAETIHNSRSSHIQTIGKILIDMTGKERKSYPLSEYEISNAAFLSMIDSNLARRFNPSDPYLNPWNLSIEREEYLVIYDNRFAFYRNKDPKSAEDSYHRTGFYVLTETARSVARHLHAITANPIKKLRTEK